MKKFAGRSYFQIGITERFERGVQKQLNCGLIQITFFELEITN